MSVSLVIPGKNAARTIRRCLAAAAPLLDRGEIGEIVFVDDASTDDTARIIAEFPAVRILRCGGKGPGAARNVGWRAATQPLVWFVDSDCVPAPDALARLRQCLEDPRVAGAGGAYGNMLPDALLPTLIHEEMEERARNSQEDVTFLRSSNMLFRRAVLEQLDGFDECRFNGPGSPGAEDMELAYRARDAGHALRFDRDSRVAHYHPQRMARYLRAQRHHGYWRVWLYYCHPKRAKGDSYTGLVDHVQPPLAVLSLISLPLAWAPAGWIAPLISALALAACQAPMTLRLIRRTGQRRMLWFAPMSFARAYWRGVGMCQGAASVLWARLRGRPSS